MLEAEKWYLCSNPGEKEPDEEIPEEEAVCRICMEDLTGEYGETFKMECSCRGELALAHKECALKWFSIKGNRTCDVCGQEVSNLPVTVVRKANESGRTVSQALNQTSRYTSFTRWSVKNVQVVMTRS